jgi:hypothetical protein
MTFQRPLNSSISAMSLRISEVIVIFVILGIGHIHFHPFIPNSRPSQENIHLYPFLANYPKRIEDAA